ncbi:HAD family hydrolase [Paenibacillus cisolokensis]|uniref:HAD family hydrolase n=1 Tax=Paenibacillus cisolokensis TaxID=1658519 RepID=UPI003D2886E1
MNQQSQHLIFDLDDTLIHCNKYFELVLGEYFEQMTAWFEPYGLTTELVRAKQIEIDVAGVNKVGFASVNFPESLIATYRFFSEQYGRELNAEEEKQLFSLGMSVYEQEVEAYPGMVETLERLRGEGHHLYLYTGGEARIQQRKIEQMKLADYFDDRIYIRQHKNVEALENILTLKHFDRHCTWMIGNSLRTDVLPALSAGINCIYIEQKLEWEYNLVEINVKPHHVLYTVSALTEVPEVIHNHLT